MRLPGKLKYKQRKILLILLIRPFLMINCRSDNDAQYHFYFCALRYTRMFASIFFVHEFQLLEIYQFL